MARVETMKKARQHRGLPNGFSRASNASADLSRPLTLFTRNSSTIPQLDGRVTPTTKKAGPPDDWVEAETEMETSKPWTESISDSCIVVKTESESHDGPSRRSRRQQLQALYNNRGAELHFSPRNIRKKLNFKSIPSTADNEEGRPRKKQRRDAIECECLVTIWDNREELSYSEALTNKRQICYLTPRETDDDNPVVDIYLDQPISIKSAELEVAVRQGGKEARGIGDKYFLEMKIIPCQEPSDWPPIKILSRSEGELFTGLGKPALDISQGALMARYMHLPQAPASDVPLSVFYVDRGRAYKTKYGLEVNAEWTKPTKNMTPSVKSEASDDKLRLTPWALDETGLIFGRKGRKLSDTKSVRRSSRNSSQQRPENLVEISYIFDAKSKETSKDLRTATIKGLKCPACRIGIFDTLSELQFHLINSHHKFKFEIESEVKDPATGELKSLTFTVNSADPKRANIFKDIKSEWEWNWEAPKKPFDLDAYVKGDHTWVGAPPVRKRGPPVPVYSSDPITALRQKNGGFLPAEAVPELPEPMRKKYPVVETNTTEKLPLFSSISHRQLRLSEEPMSESDDDMDSEWLKDKHVQTIEQIGGLTRAQREFRKRWDRHRMDEGLSHPKYLSDCLVRFVRKYTLMLREDHDIFIEYCRFVNMLKDRRVVDNAVIQGCHWIICSYEAPQPNEASKTNANASLHAHPNGVHDVETAEAHPSNNLPPAVTPASTTDPSASARAQVLLSVLPGNCSICADRIQNPWRQALRCSHDHCLAAAAMYHPACVGLSKREFEWICELCLDLEKEKEKEKGKGKGRAGVREEHRWGMELLKAFGRAG